MSPIGTYLIYALNGTVTFTATPTTLKATSQYNGVLRMAYLTNSTYQTTLDTYAPNYPTAVNTDYTFSGGNATLTFTYSVTGNASNLLILTFPHHRCACTNVSGEESHTRHSLRMSNLNLLPTTAIGYLTTTGCVLP